MAPWVKNLTAAVWVTVEVQVQCLAQCSGLKDPALLQLWHRSKAGELPYVLSSAIKKPTPQNKIETKTNKQKNN